MDFNENNIIENYESFMDLRKESNFTNKQINMFDVLNTSNPYNNDEYYDDVNIDLESLYYGVASLKKINSKCSELSGILSTINLNGSDLSSAYILDEIKMEVNGIIDEDLTDLCVTAENVKNKIAENDPIAAAFFEVLASNDAENFRDFGNSEQNVELYNSLVEKFGEENVSTSKDGSGYYVTEKVKGYKESNYYFFSLDCSGEDINLLTYLPGKNDNEGAMLVEQLKNSVPPKFAAVISCQNQDGTDILNRFDIIANDNNISVNNVQVVCFSQSGGQGFKTLNNYLGRHPENNNASITCIDGYMISPSVLEKECLNLLAKNVPIYMIGNKGRVDYQTVQGITEKLGDKGFNTYFLKDIQSSGHSAYNKNAIAGGIFYYLMGISDVYDETYCQYEVYNYEKTDFQDDKKGELLPTNINNIRIHNEI